MYPVYKHTGEFAAVEEYFDRLIVEGLDYHPEDSTHSIDTFVKRFTIRERDILDAQMNLILQTFGSERVCAAMLKRTKPAIEAAIAAAKVEPVHLLIEGDLESGFKIIGPFSDAQSGLAYRKANDLKGQVWITTTPAAYAAQWNSAA